MENNKFQNGKIYAIYSPAALPYIGATCLTLERRLAIHRQKSNKTKSKIHLEHPHHFIQLIEKFPCNSRRELDARESYYQHFYPCINHYYAYRTPEDLKNTKHKYYVSHKEQVLNHAKTKVQCECGIVCSRRNLAKHKKSKQHIRDLPPNLPV